MKDEKRDAKRALIAQAAYQLIEEKGYAGTSMLSIARAAKASNETLYNWYGDKPGLFRALVELNADEVIAVLEAEVLEHAAPLEALKAVGSALLAMLLGERAVALNRAAAADPTGVLGEALDAGGRARVAPLIGGLFADAQARGEIGGQTREVAETFVALLVGDLQIRRATHTMPAPEPSFCQARAVRALDQVIHLYPADT